MRWMLAIVLLIQLNPLTQTIQSLKKDEIVVLDVRVGKAQTKDWNVLIIADAVDSKAIAGVGNLPSVHMVFVSSRGAEAEPHLLEVAKLKPKRLGVDGTFSEKSAKAIATMSSLQLLDVHRAKFAANDMELIKKSLPACTIKTLR